MTRSTGSSRRTRRLPRGSVSGPRDVINKKCFELFHEAGLAARELPAPEDAGMKRAGHRRDGGPEERAGCSWSRRSPFFRRNRASAASCISPRDITEAKENETRLMMSERLAALGKMASGIAHEINNPLAAIAGCVDGMNRRISRGEFDQDLFKKYLTIMKEELTRSKNITTSMLSFVQTKDYEKRPVRIHETIRKSLEIIGYQGRLKRVKSYRRNWRTPIPRRLRQRRRTEAGLADRLDERA